MTDNTSKTDEQTCADRVITAVGWWTPELIVAAIAAAAAHMVWTPLLAITVVVLIRIAVEPIVNRVRARRSREASLRKVVERAKADEARNELAAANADQVNVPKQQRRAAAAGGATEPDVDQVDQVNVGDQVDGRGWGVAR